MAVSWKIVWLAGFVDGDGSITFLTDAQRKHGANPRVYICNTHLPTMQFVMDVLKELDIQYSVYPRRTPGTQLLIKVYVTAHEAVKKLISIIGPYLITKQIQAILMTEFFETHVLSSTLTKRHWEIIKEVKSLGCRHKEML